MTLPERTSPSDPILTEAPITMEPAVLQLLLPQDLPATLSLTAESRVQMRVLLSEILQAFDLEDPELRMQRLNAILHELPTCEHSAPDVGTTGTPAKPEQVQDFDRYFHVSRVASGNPAMPMVRGLLQTCVAVLALCNRPGALPLEHVSRQVDGFRAYAQTLARCFGVADPT